MLSVSVWLDFLITVIFFSGLWLHCSSLFYRGSLSLSIVQHLRQRGTPRDHSVAPVAACQAAYPVRCLSRRQDVVCLVLVRRLVPSWRGPLILLNFPASPPTRGSVGSLPSDTVAATTIGPTAALSSFPLPSQHCSRPFQV